jgi:hypothetical protein
VLAVSRRFHALVRDVPWSDSIAREHPWAIGDRWAWGELDLEAPERFTPFADELIGLRRPLDLPAQLVHMDLCNNVLFHDSLPPAVIDVSPSWRPARYAEAIIVADNIGWFGAGREAIESFTDPEGVQLLLRAILFRLGTALVAFRDEPYRLDHEVEAYGRLVSMLS